MKRVKNLIAVSFGVLFAVFLLEIFLSLWNPFPLRVNNNSLVLPANRHYIFKNTHIPNLDKEITFSNNSIGFRGQKYQKTLVNTYLLLLWEEAQLNVDFYPMKKIGPFFLVKN